MFTDFEGEREKDEEEIPLHLCRSWLMIVRGLKAFKIKMLGAVSNKTDEWVRYAWKLLKEECRTAFSDDS